MGVIEGRTAMLGLFMADYAINFFGDRTPFVPGGVICSVHGGRNSRHWDTEKLRVIPLFLAGICLVKYCES